MTLELTVLGCSGSYAGGPGDACSGYLVQSPEATVAVDLGPGSLANLQAHVDIVDLDAVVISHEHPDHWLELPVLRNAMRYYLELEGLVVYAPAGVLAQARTVIGELEPTLTWTVVDADSRVQVRDQSLSFSRTDHPVETLAVRLEHRAGALRRSFVYSADTGPGWAAGPAFAAETDLLLCEASIPVADEGSGIPHLSARQAGALAASAGAAHLVLTHIVPRVDPAAQMADAAGAYDGRLDLAVPGATFAL